MGNWKRTVNIKPLIGEDDSDAGAMKAAQAVADGLCQGLNYSEFDTPELQDIIDDLRDSPTADDFNAHLDTLYDWADQNRIWLGLKGIAT